MNELFKNIRDSKTFTTVTDLVGTWSCGSTVIWDSSLGELTNDWVNDDNVTISHYTN